MARKDFHIYTNDPDVISKIDNFEAYGFTNRNAFIIEAVRSYGMIATPEPTLRTLITESVAQGLLISFFPSDPRPAFWLTACPCPPGTLQKPRISSVVPDLPFLSLPSVFFPFCP